ncbi:MAG TPA: outer membrane lipoprotein chaperone LolA [Rhodanobacteraceae bacterium]|nr:outer membrane lipoprotein chaperone LolA [Rhodanobacteraceae bacterium]
MRALVLMALLLGAGAAQAAGTARAQLDAFADGLHSLGGSFSQTVYDANGRVSQSAHGTLALQAPRQFRWDTQAPYKQLIVADGSKVWIYDPELEQVTVRGQGSQEAHSPLTVLTNLSQLDRDFKASEQGERDGLDWLRLVSRSKDPQFEYADIGFADNAPRRMIFKDTLGNRTEIVFTDWQRNPHLPAGTFTFTPPKGTDVVGDGAAAAEQ